MALRACWGTPYVTLGQHTYLQVFQLLLQQLPVVEVLTDTTSGLAPAGMAHAVKLDGRSGVVVVVGWWGRQRRAWQCRSRHCLGQHQNWQQQLSGISGHLPDTT